MKYSILQKLALYLYNNFLGNFIGFIIGMASTKLVSHFFATRSLKNLWGLTSRKTLVDKQTFSILEWSISIIIGFLVFEIVSKGIKKKVDELMPSWKMNIKNWIQNKSIFNKSAQQLNFVEKETAGHNRVKLFRDVQ